MPHIGVDEAGKGDYFGYLVVAAVYVDDEAEKKLRALRVKDSKLLLDSPATKLAAEIRKTCLYDIVKISPEKYNLLYKKFKNLNKMLAWGHAKAIENLLPKTKAEYVITDKFGDEKFLKDALMEKGKAIRVDQVVKAESDIAVAAASVLARAEFLRTLRVLSREVGHVLPKGSTHVQDAGKFILKNYGEEGLSKLAKMHFRITKKLLSEKA